MRRRTFLACTTAGALGVSSTARAQIVPRYRREPHIAIGSNASGCSTYSRICARMENLTVLANPHLMALSLGAIGQEIPHIAARHRVPTFPWVADLRYAPRPYRSARIGRA